MESAARQAAAGARSAAEDVTDALGRAAEGAKEKLQEGASAAKVGPVVPGICTQALRCACARPCLLWLQPICRCRCPLLQGGTEQAARSAKVVNFAAWQCSVW